VTEIQEQTNRLGQRSVTGGEQADAVNHCLASIARLSNEVKDASSHLPAYDQRSYGEAIKALSSKLQEVRTSFAPRPRFSFKKGSMFTAKKNESATSLADAADLANGREETAANISNDSSFTGTPEEPQSHAVEVASEEPMADPVSLARIRRPSLAHSGTIDMGDHDGVHIHLPSSTASASSAGTLSILRRSVVDMNRPTSTGFPFAGLTLRNIKQSLVLCGHVDGAIHLTDISNSIIVVASRQFRMHESRDCDIYLLTSSRPIIEDCHNIRFAPLPALHQSQADADIENQWQSVDDFKWLRSEPSPNWSILEESKRITEDVWKNVVPGGPQYGPDDILQAVGIAKG